MCTDWDKHSELGKQVAQLRHSLVLIAINLELADKEGRDLGAYGRLALEIVRKIYAYHISFFP